MQQEIGHKGMVVEVAEKSLKAQIISHSACASCHAKGMCSASDLKEKIIDVAVEEGHGYTVGDTVEVVMTTRMGSRAVVAGYLLPLIILVLTLVVSLYFSGNEGLSALLALLVLIPYYYLLYRRREKHRKTFHFVVR